MKKHEDFCKDYIKFCDWKFENIDDLNLLNAVQNGDSNSQNKNPNNNNDEQSTKEKQVVQNIN